MSDRNKIRILLVDDHRPTRTEVVKFLETDEDMEVVGEADSGEDGVRLARKLQPNIVVMDLIMPGITGIEATKRIFANHTNTKVLSLSNYTGRIMIAEMRKAGARGYVRKAEAFEELIPAIKAIEAGKEYFAADNPG